MVAMTPPAAKKEKLHVNYEFFKPENME